MARIELHLPLPPKGQARPRHTTVNGRFHAYKTKAQQLDENKIGTYIVGAYSGSQLTGPLALHLTAFMPIPESWPKKRRQLALDGLIWPDKKPDLSNIIKHIEDIAQGLLYADDKSIVTISATKLYGHPPGYHIALEELTRNQLE